MSEDGFVCVAPTSCLVDPSLMVQPQQQQPASQGAGKTPIQILHEYGTKTGTLPVYAMEKTEGEAHQPNFIFSVTIGHITCQGQGPTKKAAKHQAAEAALKVLQTENGKGLHIVKVEDGGVSLEPVEQSNPIGILQELTLQKGWHRPEYLVCMEAGPPHKKEFTVTCRVESLSEAGIGSSKKTAKRASAEKMIMKLQNLSGCSDMHWAKSSIRLDCLRSSSGEKISMLRRNPLSIPNTDYVQMILELSQEQGFEVTYFDIDELTVNGQYQCLAELSTLPVAVCHGTGITCSNAHNDAAHSALQYIKILSSKKCP